MNLIQIFDMIDACSQAVLRDEDEAFVKDLVKRTEGTETMCITTEEQTRLKSIYDNIDPDL